MVNDARRQALGLPSPPPPLLDGQHHSREEHGALLHYRNGIGWDVLAGGSADQVLTVDSEGSPAWVNQSALTTLMGLIYPVGIIIELTVSTNPATLFGFGTWAAFGTGRVTVAIDSGDADFDTVEETGGAKTVTVGAHSELTHTGTAVTSHGTLTHTGAAVDSHGTLTHTGTAVGNHSDHTHSLTDNDAFEVGSAGTGVGNLTTSGASATLTHSVTQPSSHGTLTHSVTQPSSHGTLTHTVTQPTTHGSPTHAAASIVQPYVVVYRWLRTA